MTLKKWTNYLERLSGTPSRNAMTDILVELIGETPSEQVDKMTYLLMGRLGPLFDNPDFGLAEKQIVKSLALSSGKSVDEVTEVYKKTGDLGVVAEQLKSQESRVNDQEFSVADLYDRLLKIARENGEGSQERKISGLARLIGDCDPIGAKYAVRVVVGKLRLGFSDKTVMDALSVMEKGDKSVKEKLDLAYSIHPDIGWLVRTVKSGGVELATKEKAEVGVPIMPMLCQRLKTAREMVKKMGKVAVEPKFDGTRVLIHYDSTRKDWNVKTFTRNLEETSWMFPELREMGEHVNAKQLILDCEAVGYDPKTGKMSSFQETITRKRKHGIGEQSAKIPLRFFVFDVIYRDGESLIDKTYEERRKVLKEVIKDRGLMVVDDYWETDDPEVILKHHHELIKEGLEGIVVKKVDSKYVPGRLGWRWVKMKEAEESAAKLSDTLDCVVMGYNSGKGKRTGFGLGAFLVGVRKGEMIVTIAKVGTGLTDEQFRELKIKLDKNAVNKKPKEYDVTKNLVPDFWVEPKIIVEIAADEITKSPVHSAGVALRFPRLVRFRTDKSVREITTLGEVGEL